MPFIPTYRHSTDPENLAEAEQNPIYMKYLKALDLRENMYSVVQNHINAHLTDTYGEGVVRTYEAAIQAALDWGNANCDGDFGAVASAMESTLDVLQELPPNDLEQYRCKFCFSPWPKWF
jgi:hypothetical protein